MNAPEPKWTPPRPSDPAEPLTLTAQRVNIYSWAVSLNALLAGGGDAHDRAGLAVLLGRLSDALAVPWPPRFVARLRPVRGKRPQRWGVFDAKHGIFVHRGDGGLQINHFETEAEAAKIASRCEVYAMDVA